MRMQYTVIVEPSATGFSADSPDLPGCVSIGKMREQVEENMRETIEFHLDGLKRAGLLQSPEGRYK